MACWFKPVATNVAYGFVTIDIGNSNERFTLLGSAGATGNVRVAISGSGITNVTSTTSTYTAGVWNHAGGTFNINTGAITPYLNGIASGAASSFRVPSGLDRVRIGATAAGAFMNGDMAEIGIWNVDLSAADMAVLALGVSPLLVRRDALVGYWPLRRGSSPEIDLMSTRTAALTGTPSVSAHPRILLPMPYQIIRDGSTPPPSPPPPPSATPDSQGSGGGRRYRRPEPIRIPQQVVDDVEALYRTIYAGRKSLDATTVRAIADLVSFFAESFDGRLPPAEAIDWRRLVEYPDIDLSILRTAADFLIDLPPPPEKALSAISPAPKWAALTHQAGAVDRAMERLKRDAAAAAERAAIADREDEEDALLALLMVL